MIVPTIAEKLAKFKADAEKGRLAKEEFAKLCDDERRFWRHEAHKKTSGELLAPDRNIMAAAILAAEYYAKNKGKLDPPQELDGRN